MSRNTGRNGSRQFEQNGYADRNFPDSRHGPRYDPRYHQEPRGPPPGDRGPYGRPQGPLYEGRGYSRLRERPGPGPVEWHNGPTHPGPDPYRGFPGHQQGREWEHSRHADSHRSWGPRNERDDDRQRMQAQEWERHRPREAERSRSGTPGEGRRRQDLQQPEQQQQQQQQQEPPQRGRGAIGPAAVAVRAQSHGTPRHGSPLVAPGSAGRGSGSAPRAASSSSPYTGSQFASSQGQHPNDQQPDWQQPPDPLQHQHQQQQHEQQRQWEQQQQYQHQQQQHEQQRQREQQQHEQQQLQRQQRQQQQQQQSPLPPEPSESPPPPPPPPLPSSQEPGELQQPGQQPSKQQRQPPQSLDTQERPASQPLGYVAWANKHVQEHGLPAGAVEWHAHLGMYRDAHDQWQLLGEEGRHSCLTPPLGARQAQDSRQQLPALMEKMRGKYEHLVTGLSINTSTSDPFEVAKQLAGRVKKFFESVFSLRPTDEDICIAQQEAVESKSKRRKIKEDFDNDARGLGLRVQAMQLTIERQQQGPAAGAAGPPDPRLQPAGQGQRMLQQQLQAAAAAGGAVWVPLPAFALSEGHLGLERHRSFQQRVHGLATDSARAQVLQERPQLLQQARQRQPTGGEQQQQHEHEQDSGVCMQPELLDVSALDLENEGASWMLVGPRAGAQQKGKGVCGTLAQLRSWAREGACGVKWGALISRSSDKVQLLLQEVPYTADDISWGATHRVYDNLVARGTLPPHVPPCATAAELRGAREAAAAAVPNAVVPLEVELQLSEVCAEAASAAAGQGYVQAARERLKKQPARILLRSSSSTSSAVEDKSAAMALLQRQLDSMGPAASTPAAGAPQVAEALDAAVPGEALEQQPQEVQQLLNNRNRMLAVRASWAEQRRAAAAAETARVNALTKGWKRDAFGPPPPLESKAAFIAAIVNRASVGQHLRNKVNTLSRELIAGQQRGVGGPAFTGGRPVPALAAHGRAALPQQQQGTPLAGVKRRIPDSSV